MITESKGIWSAAFWKDAGERILFTALATLSGMVGVDVLNILVLDWRAIGIAVLSVSFMTLIKTLLAGLRNPNTGASFGTAVPGDIVQAYTNQRESRVGSYGGGEVTSHPGDTVAGPAAENKVGAVEGEPVYVQPVPPATA